MANENVPAAAVSAARGAGHDIDWVAELLAGADDDRVLARAQSDGRILLMFDKDFGELAFRRGKRGSTGVLLLRPRLRSPEHLSRLVLSVLAQHLPWEGNCCVVREGKVRILPMP